MKKYGTVAAVVLVLLLVRYNYVLLGVPATFGIAVVFLFLLLWFGFKEVTDKNKAELGKTLMEGAALFAAAIYYSYQALSGLFVASLRLSLDTERWQAAIQAQNSTKLGSEPAKDRQLIALRIRVKGAGENAIQLQHISVGWFEFNWEKQDWDYGSTEEIPVFRLNSDPSKSGWTKQDWPKRRKSRLKHYRPKSM